MSTPTLSQLADIGAAAAFQYRRTSILEVHAADPCYAEDAPAREAFAKAVLDAVGYKLPVDPEREAFDAWCLDNPARPADDNEFAFTAWKAGRDKLRKKWDIVVQDKPQPETFEAHGVTWFKHKPGDPCPCDGGVEIETLFDEEAKEGGMYKGCVDNARHWDWETDGGRTSIVGWRYANADAP
jgi:hypothetical protein